MLPLRSSPHTDIAITLLLHAEETAHGILTCISKYDMCAHCKPAYTPAYIVAAGPVVAAAAIVVCAAAVAAVACCCPCCCLLLLLMLLLPLLLLLLLQP